MSASIESKPLSAKYQRVADKKARDAAIAEAIAKGEEPPVFEDKKVVAETPVTDAAKNEEGSDEEKEEVNTGTLNFVEVDEVLRKKAANAASSLARRMSKKQGGKRVKFVELVEGELKKLVKLAGGSDEAIAKAVASERKHFAAIRAAKEAAAAKAETDASGEAVTTPVLTRKEKSQRDYEERVRARAAAAAAAGTTDTPATTTDSTDTPAAATKEQQKKPQGNNNNKNNPKNNNKKPQQNNNNKNNPKKAGPGGANAGGKKPKLDMRGLNQKQKKEKALAAAAAKKAEKDAAKKAGATTATPAVVASE